MIQKSAHYLRFIFIFFTIFILRPNLAYAELLNQPEKIDTKITSKNISKNISKYLEGQLIIGGATFYRVSRVLNLTEQEGMVTLHAEVDPLMPAQYSGNPDGMEGKRPYYDVGLESQATCGISGLATTLQTSDFLVFDKKTKTFIPLKELFPEMPWRSWDRPFNRVTENILHKIQQCSKKIATAADAMPFQKISVYADKKRITEVARTSELSYTYEEDLGESVISHITHFTIVPRKHLDINDFEIRMRAVSVMQCDYEGPHVELDRWKQGLGNEIILLRKNNQFILNASDLQPATTPLPKFPAYTKTELRRAIAQHFGNPGLASTKEAQPCQPFLRGYRFYVYYQSALVQEVFLTFPGGC